MAHSESLDDAKVGEGRSQRTGRPSGYAICVATGAMVNAGMLLLVTPKFAEIFLDFGTALPSVTRAFVAGPPWAWPVVMVAIAVLVVLKDFALSRRNCRAVDILFSVFVAAVFVLYLIAMFIPLVQLIQGLSG